jgi:CheY-like chemotaxis protein
MAACRLMRGVRSIGKTLQGRTIMGQLKLLVADDSSLMRGIIKESIEEVFPEITVSMASNGIDAQKMLSKQRFDLVLCDWQMPELKGNELLKWLRESSE